MSEPFWQRTVETLDEATVLSFLDESVPEGDHLEYKLPTYDQGGKFVFRDEFLETIVAFANTGGGMVICGVGEDDQKRPADVVGIRTTATAGSRRRDPVAVLRDTCANLLTPQISLESIAIPLSRSSNQGDILLVIRVRRGSIPPYSIRDEDIYLRNGDMDRRAKVREIAALFDRRIEDSRNLPTPWKKARDTIFGYQTQHAPEEPATLMIGLTPAFPIDSIPLTDDTDQQFERMCLSVFRSSDQLVTEPDGILFYRPFDQSPDNRTACAFNEGSVGFRGNLEHGRERLADGSLVRLLDLSHLWFNMRRALEVAYRWPHETCGCNGPLLCRMAIGNLSDVLAMYAVNGEVKAQSSQPSRSSSWGVEVEWDQNVSIDDLIERNFVSIARTMQFPRSHELLSQLREASYLWG